SAPPRRSARSGSGPSTGEPVAPKPRRPPRTVRWQVLSVTERLHTVLDTDRLHAMIVTVRLREELPVALRSIREIAAAVRGRRHDLGLSQAELASRAGVSRKWISEFESGKSTAELGLVLRVLDVLGWSLELDEEGGTQG